MTGQTQTALKPCTALRCAVDKYSMRNIDLSKLSIASPGDHTANFVQTIIKCAVNSAILNDIDQDSGLVVARQEAPETPEIEIRNLSFPEQIAQTRSEIPGAIIVCIMPAEDDAATIAKMKYHTFWKDQIEDYPDRAIALWPELAGQTTDPVWCEAAFMSNLVTKCSPEHWINTDTSAADLKIDFKTVMGLDTKDLNQIICDFLEMPRQSSFDAFISDFRTANQKYLSY